MVRPIEDYRGSFYESKIEFPWALRGAPAFPVEFSSARTGGSPGGANQSPSRVSQWRWSTAIRSKPPTATPRATDPELSASVASPTVAELRADDEGQESQIEGPRDCERKPRRPPPALQMAANIEIESSEASLNVSATSGLREPQRVRGRHSIRCSK